MFKSKAKSKKSSVSITFDWSSAGSSAYKCLVTKCLCSHHLSALSMWMVADENVCNS